MYERRIENSLHKTMQELERRQIMRQIEQQDATGYTPAEQYGELEKQNQSRPSAENLCLKYPKPEYLNPKRVKKDADLKKQTQSEPI